MLFYFDVDDGARMIPHVHGIDLSSREEACDQATELAKAIMAEGDAQEPMRAVVVTARSADGTPLFRASLVLRTEWQTALSSDV